MKILLLKIVKLGFELPVGLVEAVGFNNKASG